MTWPFGSQRRGLSAAELIAERWAGRTGGKSSRVARSEAMRHSAVWACLRLRADLISTMPLDVFRRVGGVQVEVTKPKVMLTPGGESLRWMEFVYSTQIDLDSVGNTVGVVLERDSAGKPVTIELADINEVTFKGRGARLECVQIGRREYDNPARDIWHEKQFTVSGSPIGLSPTANAARAINLGLSASEFMGNWFDNSVVPGGHLKNVSRRLNKAEASAIKANFEASVRAGEVWVSGNDWEYSMVAAKASESGFLDSMNLSLSDVTRFFGVPGDMIDAPQNGSAVTYANITQRNLQLLITNIGPAINRREEAWSYGLLPAPRYAKLNTSALLRMDDKTRMEMHGIAITNRIYPPSRALDFENLPPLTDAEKAEFATLFPIKAALTQGVAA